MSELSENEFEHEGKRYRAEPCPNDGPCYSCAFRKRRCAELPPCVEELRKDKRTVIFVEVKP